MLELKLNLDLSPAQALYLKQTLSGQSSTTPLLSSEEWKHFVAQLGQHAIIPIFYWQIRSFPPEHRPPEEIIQHLREIFMASSIRYLQMEQQLKEVTTAFSKMNIPFLVLKGPAFARMIYPEPAMRASGDLDVLFLPSDVPRVRPILEKLGYHCREKMFEKLGDFRNEEFFLPQANKHGRSMIEVHWDIHAFYGMNRAATTAELFKRAIEFKSPNLSFKTLNSIDSLLHAAIHAAFVHPQNLRLSWIYDITLLAQQLKNEEAWKTLQAKSVEWHGRLAVENLLQLTVEWTGYKTPFGFNDFSSWPAPSKKEKEGWEMVTIKQPSFKSFLKSRLPASGGIKRKLQIILMLIFPVFSLSRLPAYWQNCRQRFWHQNNRAIAKSCCRPQQYR